MTSVTRRTLLQQTLSLAALQLFGSRAFAAAGDIRIEAANPGTAGAVWKPLLERNSQLLGGLHPQWAGGDPGQVQLQLLSGAIDVGFFGPLGAAESQLRGNDILIFAPGLLNHGSWIVKGNSSYRTPHDLIGKSVAAQPQTSETFRQARVAASLQGIDLMKDLRVIFGPPTANLALFERGDVEAVITIEPIASRLIANGAREIAKVRDMWGRGSKLFLGGLAAKRQWIQNNQSTAALLAKAFATVNRQIKAKPQLASELHASMGIPDSDTKAIQLLAKRLPEIYATEWDNSVFADIDRQIDEAVKTKILTQRSSRPVYEKSTSGAVHA